MSCSVFFSHLVYQKKKKKKKKMEKNNIPSTPIENIDQIDDDEVFPSEPPAGLKICCACPETRKVRDLCVVQNGEEKCPKEIFNHKLCLRRLGFKI